MLKTSSTKRAEPRKGVVVVGSSGRNRAEPIGKYEVDGVDDGGGRSSDFDRRFHSELHGNFECDFSNHPLALPTLFICKSIT